MNKNLVDKLPQSQLEAVNPNVTPFPVLDQHGGVVPLFLQKKLDCIKFKFSKPQHICCKSLIHGGRMPGQTTNQNVAHSLLIDI